MLTCLLSDVAIIGNCAVIWVSHFLVHYDVHALSSPFTSWDSIG